MTKHRIERSLGEAKEQLEQASTEEQFQTIGLLCRETLISLAQEIYDPNLHHPTDDVTPSKTDAKRMLDGYLKHELSGQTHKYARKYATSALDLANELQHKRTASFRDAALCLEATTAVVKVIGLISGQLELESHEPPLDVTSRLQEFGLRSTSDPNFGVTKLTNNLFQFVKTSPQAWEFEFQSAISSTIFLSIPTTSLKSGSNTILKLAREVFDPTTWHKQKPVEQTNPRFRSYAYNILPLHYARFRTEQKEIVAEYKIRNQELEIELDRFVLRVNEFREVSFATAFDTIQQSKDGTRIFRLGAIIHLFWSFLCMIGEFQEVLGYTGNNHICIAMVNTEGSYLGNFAKGQPNDILSIETNPSWLLNGYREICHDSNLLIRRDVDLSTFEPKVEPEIIYDVAEEIARAFNQPEARCFDKQTRKLPNNLWPIKNP